MYANTAEAADARTSLNLEVIQRHVGGCREWLDDEARICGKPSEYVLWGKLIPAVGLGPRCYDHAAEHVGDRALGDPSWAIVDLPALAERIDKAHFPLGTR